MKTHSVLNFLVFNLCLVIGYTFSIRFYLPGDAIVSGLIETITTESQTSIAAMNNGQRTILLISISSIDALAPQLESVWLATYLPRDTSIQLLPIFPSGKQLTTNFEKQLALAFKLSKAGGKLGPDQGFLRLLEQNNYWWSGYIVFDEQSLTKIYNQIGGLDLNRSTLTGSQVVQDFTDVNVNSQDAYSSQVAILQSVCHKLTAASLNPDILKLGTQVPANIITNLDTHALQMELETVYSGDHHPTCRFPTLEISRIEQ
jgi:hypothetical protein